LQFHCGKKGKKESVIVIMYHFLFQIHSLTEFVIN